MTEESDSTVRRAVLRWLALLGGALGTLLCLAAIVATLAAARRLERVSKAGFAGVDQSLEVVAQRVSKAQTTLRQSRQQVSELSAQWQSLAGQQLQQRLADRIRLDGTLAQVQAGFSEADRLLQLAESTSEGIRRTLEFGQRLGVPFEPAAMADIDARCAARRQQINDLAQGLEGLTSLGRDAENDGATRRDRLLKWCAVAIDALTDLNEGLSVAGAKIADLRDSSGQREASVRRTVRWGALAAAFVLVWLAAGQAALLAYGWRRRSADPRGAYSP